jgi:hypothetical protein
MASHLCPRASASCSGVAHGTHGRGAAVPSFGRVTSFRPLRRLINVDGDRDGEPAVRWPIRPEVRLLDAGQVADSIRPGRGMALAVQWRPVATYHRGRSQLRHTLMV